jgi:hypothetical protein
VRQNFLTNFHRIVSIHRFRPVMQDFRSVKNLNVSVRVTLLRLRVVGGGLPPLNLINDLRSLQVAQHVTR